MIQRFFIHVGLLLLGMSVLQGQPAPTPRTDLWLASGPVNAIAITNQTIYLGGSFSYVGPQTGPAITFNQATGEATERLPRIEGDIFAVESDGAGGWFLAGQFNSVAGQRITNLVHVLADRTLDPDWTTGVAGTRINALVRSGGILYLAGQFTRVGGKVRNGLAAINLADGQVTAWDPQVQGQVLALKLSADLAYVGGNYQSIGDSNRNNIAAIRLDTGRATAWNPNASDGTVIALAITDSMVYAGGTFTAIGTKPRNRLAALDPITGVAANWNPNPNGTVRTLWATDTAVFVGGEFTTIAVQARRGFAGINRSGLGAALPMDLQITDTTTTSLVRALWLEGDTLYVGGSFVNAQGRRQPMIAAASITTGEPVLTVPLGTTYNGTSDSVSIGALAADGGIMLAAGNFLSLGGVARTNAAAISAVSGRVLPWRVTPSSPVLALAVGNGTVYVGGGFTNVNGATSEGLVAVDPITGALKPNWVFTAKNQSSTPIIRALYATTNLYLGGQFTSIGEKDLRHVAAVDVETGLPTLFNAKLGGGSEGVNALALAGEHLFLAGDFSTVNSVSRARLAAVNKDSGAPVSWGPVPNQVPHSLATTRDRLYVAGPFTRISGISIRLAVAYDLATLTLIPWDPSVPSSSSEMYAVAADETAVYLAGNFESIGGEFRKNLAGLGPLTAQAFEWNPTPNQPPTTILLTEDYLSYGGSFRTVGRSGEVYPLGYFAVHQRAPLILSSQLTGNILKLKTTTGDRTLAILEATPSLAPGAGGWVPLATNDLVGYLWTLDIPTSPAPQRFFRVRTE